MTIQKCTRPVGGGSWRFNDPGDRTRTAVGCTADAQAFITGPHSLIAILCNLWILSAVICAVRTSGDAPSSPDCSHLALEPAHLVSVETPSDLLPTHRDTMSVPQPVPKWDVDTVASFIGGIGLPQLVDAFKSNAVNGADLIALSDDDFTSSLGCTPLQVRRARCHRVPPTSRSPIPSPTAAVAVPRTPSSPRSPSRPTHHCCR